jgi:MFS transporter, SET family, sugar efflux transporter
MAFAAITPYRAIAAIDTLGMSNSLYALVMTLSSVGTAIASLVLGHFADRSSDRRVLVVACAILGALGYGLIYLFPTQLIYIVAFCVILPFGGALFSQVLAFSRVYYDVRYPQRSEFMMSVQRTLFSLAWVMVPPLAGWIASAYSVFDVFAATALAHVGCTLIFGLLFADVGAKIGTAKKQPGSEPASWQIPQARLIGIGGVTLMRVALALHMTALPLVIIKDFGGTLKDVGFNAAIAAGLEIPFMLAWGLGVSRISKESILIINAFIYALYLLLVFYANSVREVLWLQGLNAVATAALVSIPISYMQEAIKGRVGLSTALLNVVTVASTFFAALVFSVFSREESYIVVFVAASILSFLGAIILAFSRLPRFTGKNST